MSSMRPILRRIFGIKTLQSPNATVIVEEDVVAKSKKQVIQKSIRRPHDICKKNMTFKLWSRVHSSGQGYITYHPKSGQSNSSLASSGTSDDAAALQFVQVRDEDIYKITFKFDSKTYFFYCDNDAVIASEDVNDSTTFLIEAVLQNEQEITRYFRIKFEDGSGKMKMLKVGSDDRLTATLFDKEKIDKIDERFLGLACSFVIDLS